MKLFLAFTPIILVILALFIYRFNGKKELLKMDLIQFIYAFFITPTIIIWIKTMVFVNLKYIPTLSNPEDMFLIDTSVTTVLIIIYAFVVMHSLTKTFAIKKAKDPLVDIFEHSEYFHEWLTHIIIYSFNLFCIFIIGLVNNIFPIEIFTKQSHLLMGIFGGLISGGLFYLIMLFSRLQNQKKFDRLLKLQVYFYSAILMTTYIVYRPKIDYPYTIFWFSITFLLTSTLLLQDLNRRRIRQLQQNINIIIKSDKIHP